MTQIRYYYVGNNKPNTKNEINNQFVSDGKLFNPIFNFDQSFVEQLQSIAPTDLAQSQPYISIKTVRLDGTIQDDLNMSFFQKSLNTVDVKNNLRYSDRNIMSLQDIELNTDLASGYLYYTNVKLRIKIHKPDALANSSLVALLFPGMPLILQYGWNSPNELLNQKENLLFSVKTYDLTFDESGQIDLLVEGTAFNDRFNNTLVGDTGQEVVTDSISNEEFDGIFKNYNQIKLYQEYLDDIKKRNDSNANDFNIVKGLTESFKTVENKARGIISKNFSNFRKRLSDFKINIAFSSKLPSVECVKFHDVVFCLCNETFKALNTTFPNVSEMRIIYGNFNDKTPRSNKSIAEFPIDLKKFNQRIKTFYDQGKFVPTISDLLNLLVNDFIENEEYWKGLFTKHKEFNKPDVIVNFFNNGNTLDLVFLDIKNGLPVTTSRLPKGKASSSSAKEAVLNGTDLPVFEIGHSNSFIKKISMSQLSDQYMKAALIERMFKNRIIGPRSTIAPGPGLVAKPVTPLTVPLKGTASVIGHPGWKPFKAFYLSAGFFVIDAVYKIQKVSHKLSAGNFDTQIEFMWH